MVQSLPVYCEPEPQEVIGSVEFSREGLRHLSTTSWTQTKLTLAWKTV